MYTEINPPEDGVGRSQRRPLPQRHRSSAFSSSSTTWKMMIPQHPHVRLRYFVYLLLLYGLVVITYVTTFHPTVTSLLDITSSFLVATTPIVTSADKGTDNNRQLLLLQQQQRNRVVTALQQHTPDANDSSSLLTGGDTTTHTPGVHQNVPHTTDDDDDDDSGTEQNMESDPDQVEDDVGIVSNQNVQFFRTIQNEIDMIDPKIRCARYNYAYHLPPPEDEEEEKDPHPPSATTMTAPRRRIFYGALIADESYELLNIVATEAYGIYSGIVLVESNRTQSFVPRPWKHVWSTRTTGTNVHTGTAVVVDHDMDDDRTSGSSGIGSTTSSTGATQQRLATLFGMTEVSQLMIVPYIDENEKLKELTREHAQRNEIIRGWKLLGMQPDDIGVLSDTDETFTRDYLRAIQQCDNIPQFQYEQHQCHHSMVKVVAHTRVFESSPECITDNRAWYHPDIIMGHCIEGIGDATLHPPAPRESRLPYLRALGFGNDCTDWEGENKITDRRYPAWNAADFRRTCSGKSVVVLQRRHIHDATATSSSTNDAGGGGDGNNSSSSSSSSPYTNNTTNTSPSILGPHTGYHFHNFFTNFNTTRFKYLTYGHATEDALYKPISLLSNDLQMMYRCVNNLTDTPKQKWKRIEGGYRMADPFLPIYFHDADYRQRRHEHVRTMTVIDDEMIRVYAAMNDTSLLSSTTTTTTTNASSSYATPTIPSVTANEEAPNAVQSNKLPPTAIRGHMTSSVIKSSPTGNTDFKTKFHTPTSTGSIENPFRSDANTATSTTTDPSASATVMASATNYDIATYRRFVGSLRQSGYTGHIMIGLQPDPSPKIINYLTQRNVTVHILSWVNCTYTSMDSSESDIFQQTTCAYPYPDIKIRWSRFPLFRDWLLACTTCTGPVLVTDARDVIFQRNPFGDDVPSSVQGLQVFQEHVNMTTTNWLTEWPIRECKGVTYKEPMLCSGTTIGTREAMLQYLAIMYEEMKVWISDPKCRFDINGDDQSIHNYLYYSGRLPFATSIPNRHGGIVNTIGHHAAQLYKQYIRTDNSSVPDRATYPGANAQTWIGPEFNLTNADGWFIEFDGSISRVVHQWDRFNAPYVHWLRHQSWNQG
jgi:hypothetical protein